MKINNIKSWSTEKISQRVFYCLIGIAAVVFALFFFIGYDMPFEENPDFNAPLFTDVLIVLMGILFVAAVVLAVLSAVKGYRKAATSGKMVNGIPERKIFRITWLSTLCLLVITFLVGSSVPMRINGGAYDDWAWLKLSDMFVSSSVVMLLAAVVVAAYGATRYIRKGRKS